MYWLFDSLLAVWNHDENTKSACQYSAYVQLSLRRGVYFTQLRINIMCRTKNMPYPKSRYTPKHRHCRQAFIPWETTWQHLLWADQVNAPTWLFDRIVDSHWAAHNPYLFPSVSRLKHLFSSYVSSVYFSFSSAFYFRVPFKLLKAWPLKLLLSHRVLLFPRNPKRSQANL